MLLKNILFSTLFLLLVGCGGSSGDSISPKVDNNSSYINDSGYINNQNDSDFKNLELYSFNLQHSNGKGLTYQMNKIDIYDAHIIPYYFNFTSDEFEIDAEDKQIFVNTERGSSNNIDYTLESNGDIIAKKDEKSIFRLSLNSVEDVQLKELDEYRFKPLALKGKKYIAKKEYLVNYYKIKRLTSDTSFDNLEEFIIKHTKIPFIGGIAYGLVFGKEGKLQTKQQEDAQYANVGTYKIKEIDGQKTLFIYPDNLNRYDAHGCYILDYGFVWEAKCYLKGSSQEINFYNKEIYDPILEYMQTSFVDITITS